MVKGEESCVVPAHSPELNDGLKTRGRVKIQQNSQLGRCNGEGVQKHEEFKTKPFLSTGSVAKHWNRLPKELVDGVTIPGSVKEMPGCNTKCFGLLEKMVMGQRFLEMFSNLNNSVIL